MRCSAQKLSPHLQLKNTRPSFLLQQGHLFFRLADVGESNCAVVIVLGGISTWSIFVTVKRSLKSPILS
jgi:hypothetical protein